MLEHHTTVPVFVTLLRGNAHLGQPHGDLPSAYSFQALLLFKHEHVNLCPLFAIDHRYNIGIGHIVGFDVLFGINPLQPVGSASLASQRHRSTVAFATAGADTCLLGFDFTEEA